jgi:AcrR family transcriptional regulator
VSATSETDGRRLRREVNRQAVLEALAAFHRDGIYDPTMAEVAERAGLSQRSLFRYFDDIDDLTQSAVERQVRRAAPITALSIDPSGPTGDKARLLVAARVRVFEEVAPSARAARIRTPRNPVLAANLAAVRGFLRSQLREVFAPELEAIDDRAAVETLAALDVLCSFESYDLLRTDQQLSLDEVERVLVRSVLAILGSAA